MSNLKDCFVDVHMYFSNKKNTYITVAQMYKMFFGLAYPTKNQTDENGKNKKTAALVKTHAKISLLNKFMNELQTGCRLINIKKRTGKYRFVMTDCNKETEEIAVRHYSDLAALESRNLIRLENSSKGNTISDERKKSSEIIQKNITSTEEFATQEYASILSTLIQSEQNLISQLMRVQNL